MGTLVGHVAPGAGFLLIGLWQLFNHIRLFALRPDSYAAPLWFPARGVRHLELILIIAGTSASILMELVIGPAKHQPFDDDGTIPLLQTVVAVTLATTLLGIPCPRSFVVSLVRSASLVLQGVWLIVMGVMLWTPGLVSKGCFLNHEDGHDVVRCRTDEALHRAKALVNLQFSWYLTGTMVFVVVLYLQVSRLYPEEPQYLPLVKGGPAGGRFSVGDDHEDEDDMEAAKSTYYGQMVSGGTKPMEVER
ncbi:unnamed protein product [Triticum turgidum subsp. durum]|uniref:Uncharacterized protein n=1 Tax=Triticum turgidum subsp. durum TaxID=4567 RepID=A0A9R0TQG1_TRITD|nr:unnamed protein product [Triticum turgidum subsp. durum]